MALGGGAFTAQNKILPGTYINFVSTGGNDTADSERGIAAVPIELDWFADDAVITVTAAQFVRRTKELFAQDYASDALRNLREVFRHATTAHIYRLNSGGAKASNAFGTAMCSGIRGNDIKIVIQKNVNNDDLWDVETLLGMTRVDRQTVASAADLIDNTYVKWNTSSELAATAATPMTGGENGAVTSASYQAALDALEAYTFHTLACPSADDEIKALYAAYTKRQREDVGSKFQTVVCNYKADYEGVINLVNTLNGDEPTALVYWTTGANAACAVNSSLTNTTYDGEYDIPTNRTQLELENGILAGEFQFHRVDDEVRVLVDINSLTTTTDEKSADFSENQVIRIIDKIATDTAAEYNRNWLGKVQNNASGRIGFRAWIVKHRQAMVTSGAIEEYDDSLLTVEAGEKKKTVVVREAVEPTVAMTTLYLTTAVS